jgi:hypothetical protein
MRVVLDANVLISATLIPDGTPANVLDAWHDQRYELLLSPPILEEVADVIRRPRIRKRHGWSDEEIETFLEGFRIFGIITPGELEVNEIEDDPDDNIYLACAAEGAADYIVSGDVHLQNLIAYQEIPILTPRQFWEILSGVRQ